MSQKTPRDVSRRSFLVSSGAAGALALAGCTQETGEDAEDGGSTDGGDGLSGTVDVKGSSTVFQISDSFAEAFMEENDAVNVPVSSTGTGGGFRQHFCTGQSDINGASRPITESEKESCSENDVEYVEFEIASDALTVAVNNDADWATCVTPDELSQIWRENGAEQWSDVRPEEWPDDDFTLFGPASTSGTYDWFNNNVIGEEYRHTTDHQPTEQDDKIVQGIRDNKTAMGYFGYAYYKANSDSVKALEIDTGDGCVEPSLANAKDDSYPLARPLYIYVNKSSLERDAVYEFVKFYLERAETSNVNDIGYVPSSTDQRDSNLEKLDRVADQ